MTIIPPGSGIVHQVNLEYLGRVVFNMDGVLYPDSVVGTDSHTTMINGLGIVGWGKFYFHFYCLLLSERVFSICIGNSMICSDIWHKYHE